MQHAQSRISDFPSNTKREIKCTKEYEEIVYGDDLFAEEI